MRFLFGDFELDSVRHVLLRHGRPVRIEPRPLRLLLALLERAPNSVGKRELIDQVWPDVRVTEGSLTRAIREIRRVLREHANAPGTVRTVRGVGYAIEADVQRVASGAPKAAAGAGPGPGLPAEAESGRRQLAVLACVIRDSDRWAASLDPEIWKELVLEFRSRCQREIGLVGGVVSEFNADGLLACVGFPNAQEDDLSRALTAARRLLEKPIRLSPDQDVALGVGLHSGLVVVTGTEEGRPQLFGEAPILARSLASRSPAGGILVTEATRLLLPSGVEVEHYGSKDQESWRIVADAPFHRDLHLLPFVGREAELAQAEQSVARAAGGEGQVLLLSGEPGIGKTRLVEELRLRSSSTPRWWKARCSPSDRHSPLQPLRDLFQNWQRGLNASGSGEDALSHLLTSVDTPERWRGPIIAEVMPQARTEEGWASRDDLLQEVADVMLRVSLRQPFVVVVEDVHWADRSTLELLRHLIRRLSRYPVALILTFRPEFVPPWPSRPAIKSLALDRLPARDIQRLAIAALKGDGDEEAHQIAERSDGIPLFAIELARSRREDDAGEVPTALRALLRSRLDRTGPARKTAELASAIGREFDAEFLAAVGDLAGAELDEQLLALEVAGIILAIPGGARDTYAFAHALIRDTAHDSILVSERHALHNRIAKTLEEAFPERSLARPDRLAQHWTEAEAFERASRQWARSARAANRKGAYNEAVDQARRGLELVPKVSEPRAQAAAELELQLALAQALTASRGFVDPEVVAAFTRSRRLCETIGDPERMFRSIIGLVQAAVITGPYQNALELNDQLFALAAESGRSDYERVAHQNAGLAFFSMGHSQKSAESLKASLTSGLVNPAFVVSQGYLALALWLNGEQAQSALQIDETLDDVHNKSHGLQFVLGQALICAGALSLLDRNPALTLERAATLAQVGQEHQMGLITSTAMIQRGAALAEMGELAQGIQDMEDGFALAAEIRQESHQDFYVPFLVEAHIAEGDTELALEVAKNRSDERSGVDKGHRYNDVELLRLVALASPPGRNRDILFERAFQLALEKGQRAFALRARLSQAKVQGEAMPAQAQRELGELIDLLQPLGSTPDLEDAKARRIALDSSR